MDELDERILAVLQNDGRASYLEIGEALGVSRGLVSSRVAAMLASGQVQIVAAIHPRILGLSTLAHLSVRATGPLEELFEALTAMDSVVFLSETTGPFQAVAEVRTRTNAELAATVDRLQARPEVVELRVLLYNRVLHSLFASVEDPDPVVELDDVDRRIMRVLQRNGRLGYEKLGESVGLSASASRARTRRLLAARVITIGAIRRRTGATSSDLLIGLGITTHGDPDEVAGRLSQAARLEFLAHTIGTYNLVATLVVDSLAEYTRITRDLRRVRDVAALDSWVHAAVHAERYDQAGASGMTGDPD